MSATKQDGSSLDISQLYLWNMPDRACYHPGFHMPGHAGARFFSKEYADALLLTDTTELSSSDDLHRPFGPALFAMRESAEIYGSAETVFVTTGSTTGIHVMLASVAAPDTFLLLPRTVHMSVLHAIALLDIKYAFIPFPDPDPDRLMDYPYPQVTPGLLSNALSKYPHTTDILLTSPDYYGQCADLLELAKIAHRHKCRLLVDEAHGSHLTFAKDLFPADAMSCAADICVQSLHKTLPALTMASQIHISSEAVQSGRIHVSRVWEMLGVFETSSPSFVIAASSEYAIAWMRAFGHSEIEARMEEIQRFSRRIGSVFGSRIQVPDNSGLQDPMHLILLIDPDLAFAPTVMKTLEKHGIHIEFADIRRLVLIISPWQKEEDFEALFEALSDAVSEAVSENQQDSGRCKPVCGFPAKEQIETDRLWGRLQTVIPCQGIDLRAAFFGAGKRKTIDLSCAKGKICAQAIIPYPPGIALIWPGERIAKEHVELLERLNLLNIEVKGIETGRIVVLSE